MKLWSYDHKLDLLFYAIYAGFILCTNRRIQDLILFFNISSSIKLSILYLMLISRINDFLNNTF